MISDEPFAPMTVIENKIHIFRGQKVMFDRDLAELYGVSTKVLNQSVKRNQERFPIDFVITLTKQESEQIKSHQAISRSDKMGVRKPSVVFTELGVAMLSSVLRSPRAIAVNIQIMRTFSRLREMLAESDDLRRKVEALEKQYDENFKIVFDAIRNMISDDAAGKAEIGFRAE